MAAVGDPRGYYQALGVDRTASAEDIRTAFRLRAKELHPDRAGDTGDREAFRRLREAYEALRDPHQRLRYDAESLAGDRAQEAVAETTAGTGTAWWLSRLPILPVAAAVAACVALVGGMVATHRSGALAEAEEEIAGLRRELADAVQSKLAPPLLEVELRFARGTAELDAAMRARLEAATAALRRHIAALPAGSRWQVAVDGLIDRAADQRGLLVDAWERTLLRVGVTAQYLVGHGIPADRVAVRFQAGDITRRSPSRGEAIVLSLTCCTDPASAP